MAGRKEGLKVGRGELRLAQVQVISTYTVATRQKVVASLSLVRVAHVFFTPYRHCVGRSCAVQVFGSFSMLSVLMGGCSTHCTPCWTEPQESQEADALQAENCRNALSCAGNGRVLENELALAALAWRIFALDGTLHRGKRFTT